LEVKRIIQNEPEPEPSVETEAAAPVVDEREAWLRRACFLGAVVGYFIIGAIHPADLEVGDTTLYIGIHLVQPFFILLLAWGTWLLVKIFSGRAAQWPASRSFRTRSRTPCSMRSRRRAGRIVRLANDGERGGRRRRAATDGHQARLVGAVLGEAASPGSYGPRRRYRRQADRRSRPDAADGDRRGDSPLATFHPADRHRSSALASLWLEVRREHASGPRRNSALAP
jgi:hypothetical protein